jgi:hypothetical protein
MTNLKPEGSSPPGKHPPSRFFGALLMAVGALIVVLCGLCSIAYVVSNPGISPNSGSGSGAQLYFLPGDELLVGIVGGVPIALGVVTFVVGVRLFRRP